MRLTLTKTYFATNRLSLLLWGAITVLFLYERTYLIQKAGLPHFVACGAVRVGLLLLLCYVHIEKLVPYLLLRRRYGRYVLLTILAISAYLLVQGLYDYYLFRFVIGDQQRAGLWLNFPYNLIVTVWYLLLTYLVHRTVYVVRPAPEPPNAAVADGTLIIKTGTQWVRLPVDAITYAQGLKDYTILYTPDNKYIVKGSIGKVANWLPPGDFVRVHKSYLVARRHVKSVSATEIRVQQQAVPIGRAYVPVVMENLRSCLS